MNFLPVINKLKGIETARRIMLALAEIVRALPNYQGDIDAQAHVSALIILSMSKLMAPNHLLIRIDRARAAYEMIRNRVSQSAHPSETAAREQLTKLYDLVDRIEAEMSRPGAVFTQEAPSAGTKPAYVVEVISVRGSRGTTTRDLVNEPLSTDTTRRIAAGIKKHFAGPGEYAATSTS